jgi:hypothetical protein
METAASDAVSAVVKKMMTAAMATIIISEGKICAVQTRNFNFKALS